MENIDTGRRKGRGCGLHTFCRRESRDLLEAVDILELGSSPTEAMLAIVRSEARWVGQAYGKRVIEVGEDKWLERGWQLKAASLQLRRGSVAVASYTGHRCG
jgi:hypothetical protein